MTPNSEPAEPDIVRLPAVTEAPATFKPRTGLVSPLSLASKPEPLQGKGKQTTLFQGADDERKNDTGRICTKGKPDPR